MLTRRQRHDTRDPDRRELKLIRVGHYLWSIFKKERGKPDSVNERMALEAALQAVWDAKKALRQDIAVERAVESEASKAAFAKFRANRETKLGVAA
jgi:hypothetical protein